MWIAAETVAWFLHGGKRYDYYCDPSLIDMSEVEWLRNLSF